MKIVVLFPTESEAQWFEHDQVTKIISGVGLTDTAYQTLKAIYQHQPDWLILAGIAGYFPHANLKLGDVCAVRSEVEGDLGFFTETGFVHLAELPLDMEFARRQVIQCPYIASTDGLLPTARGLSANTALSPLPDTSEVDLENMEGAAFFHVCQQEKQRFLEIRAISNEVKLGHSDWDMEGSIRSLTRSLQQLVEHLLTQPLPAIR